MDITKVGFFYEIRERARFTILEKIPGDKEVMPFLVYEKTSESTATCLGYMINKECDNRTLMSYQGSVFNFERDRLIVGDYESFLDGIVPSREIANRLFLEATRCGITDKQKEEVVRRFQELIYGLKK